MKQRLVEAVRAKARRGEFRQRLPAGYDWDEAGRIQKTPDEQVRSSIASVFARFDELGSVHRVRLARWSSKGFGWRCARAAARRCVGGCRARAMCLGC